MKLWHWFLSLNRYQKISFLTIILTFTLILIGSLVRAAGAGLGCPDWPKCFGMWIPPTSASELPAGYDVSAFNPLHTWMEYINRLTGVLVGIMITATFLSSLSYRKVNPAVFYSSVIAFLLVLFQGWLGGRVVASGLTGWLITTHMLVALLIVNVLMYGFFQAMRENLKIKLNHVQRRGLYSIALLLLTFTLLQVVLGTQVREAIEGVARSYPALERAGWIAEVGWIDQVHRTASWLVLGAGVWLWYRTRNFGAPGIMVKLSLVLNGVIVAQVIAGIVLVYFGMPPAFMVFHLVAASLLVTGEVLYILMLRYSRETV